MRKEVSHPSATGIQEIANLVIHILENIGKLVLLYPYSLGSYGHSLEISDADVCNSRKVGYLRCRIYRRPHHRRKRSNSSRDTCTNSSPYCFSTLLNLFPPFNRAALRFVHAGYKSANLRNNVQSQSAQ